MMMLIECFLMWLKLIMMLGVNSGCILRKLFLLMMCLMMVWMLYGWFVELGMIVFSMWFVLVVLNLNVFLYDGNLVMLLFGRKLRSVCV